MEREGHVKVEKDNQRGGELEEVYGERIRGRIRGRIRALVSEWRTDEMAAFEWDKEIMKEFASITALHFIIL